MLLQTPCSPVFAHTRTVYQYCSYRQKSIIMYSRFHCPLQFLSLGSTIPCLSLVVLHPGQRVPSAGHPTHLLHSQRSWCADFGPLINTPKSLYKWYHIVSGRKLSERISTRFTQGSQGSKEDQGRPWKLRGVLSNALSRRNTCPTPPVPACTRPPHKRASPR